MLISVVSTDSQLELFQVVHLMPPDTLIASSWKGHTVVVVCETQRVRTVVISRNCLPNFQAFECHVLACSRTFLAFRSVDFDYLFSELVSSFVALACCAPMVLTSFVHEFSMAGRWQKRRIRTSCWKKGSRNRRSRRWKLVKWVVGWGQEETVMFVCS